MTSSLTAIIACAMEEEIAPFLSAATELEQVHMPASPQDFQRIYRAQLDQHSVLLVRSGIGLVNGAVAAIRALSLAPNPHSYILAGTTGGLAKHIEVGDIVAGTRALFSEADATIFGYAAGQIPQMPADYRSGTAPESIAKIAAHAGTVLSGNSFVTAKNVASKRELFPDALATDMETAAAAQVCHLYGVNWLSLRAVSDLCGPKANQEFHLEVDHASRLSFAAVRGFLDQSS